MSEFENKVLLYLRNIATKLINLSDRLDVLEAKFMHGLRCNSEAFNQTKTVVQAIANETKETRKDIAEYGGVIEGESFF